MRTECTNEAAVSAEIAKIVATAVNNSKVTIGVDVSEFDEATAGSADTTKEGENGKAIFTVTASVGSHTYTTDAITVVIIIVECIFSNLSYAIGNRDACKTRTTIECILSNRSYAIGNSYTC